MTAQVRHTRSTDGVESISTPSISNRIALAEKIIFQNNSQRVEAGGWS
jgi:hypothetical protein